MFDFCSLLMAIAMLIFYKLVCKWEREDLENQRKEKEAMKKAKDEGKQ